MSRLSTSGVYFCATDLAKTRLRKAVACTRRAGVASRRVYVRFAAAHRARVGRERLPPSGRPRACVLACVRPCFVVHSSPPA
eukprot:308414-Pleurochrysis_carterae.AAC.1